MKTIPDLNAHRLARIGWVLFFAVIVARAQTGALDVTQLMQILAKVESHEAVFTEKKQISLLTDPLVNKGTLRYRRPNYVERNTLEPKHERFVYENDRIVIEANGRQRQIQASAQPVFGAMIESIRATLAGDEEALRRHYKMRLTGSGANWVLELTPLHAELAQRIRQIRIAGAQAQLRQFDIQETSGDLTQMTIDTLRH